MAGGGLKDDVSFEISSEEIVGFAGLNGVGKTTTIKVASGVLRPSGGDVLINNVSIVRRKIDIASKVSWTPEFPMLDLTLKPWDVFHEIGKYLSYGRRETRERFEESMEKISMTDDISGRIWNMSDEMRKGF